MQNHAAEQHWVCYFNLEVYSSMEKGNYDCRATFVWESSSLKGHENIHFYFSAFVMKQKSCLKFCCPAIRFIITIIIGPILKKQNQSGCIFN